MRRLTRISLLVGLVGAACAKPAAAPPPPPPREVQALTLAPTELRKTGEYLGTLVSREGATVGAQVTGYVRKIHVKPGQVVAAGAPLVEIDAREEAAALSSAVASRQAAQARLRLAQQTRDRTEALLKEGLATAQEADRTRADVASAEADAGAASAQIQQRQVQVQFGVVRAPVAGVVGDIQVNVGDSVTPSTRLTTIGGAQMLEVDVSVPANRARGLAMGSPLELLDTDDKVLVTAPISFISDQADPRTQLVQIHARFPNQGGLRPNELIRVRIVYGVSQALQVPPLSVVRQSGQPFVFAIVPKDAGLVVVRKPITLGVLGEKNYVVESGLAPGDKIAVSSLQLLRDGAAVTIAAPKAAKPAEPAKAP